jgi:hypothetical protein
MRESALQLDKSLYRESLNVSVAIECVDTLVLSHLHRHAQAIPLHDLSTSAPPANTF